MIFKVFIISDEKKVVVERKLLKLYYRILGKFRYENFGINALIYHPDRIVGKERISIGNNVYIMHHARIETIGNGRLWIGDNTSIEERCHIIAADDLRIGNECVISADVYISDCNHGYKIDTPIMQQPLEVKNTKIGEHCFIGIGAKIMPGVSLGDNCVVGAGSVVTHSFAANSIIAGVPAKLIKMH